MKFDITEKLIGMFGMGSARDTTPGVHKFDIPLNPGQIAASGTAQVDYRIEPDSLFKIVGASAIVTTVSDVTRGMRAGSLVLANNGPFNPDGDPVRNPHLGDVTVEFDTGQKGYQDSPVPLAAFAEPGQGGVPFIPTTLIMAAGDVFKARFTNNFAAALNVNLILFATRHEVA